jgi:hypothetical protein
MQIIPKEKFTFAFEKLGWDNYVSEDGRYIVWTFKQNTDIWTLVPRDEKVGEYLQYQLQNIKLILFSLDLLPTQENITKIYEQLLGFHYPIISRLTSKNRNFDGGIPLNLADTILNKIHSSFLSFRKSFNQELVNNLKFGHTQQGSFILKILVPISEDEKNILFDNESQTSFEIKNYLNQVQELTRIETADPKIYADKIVSNGISSCLVEGFVGKDGIAEILQKYIDDKSVDDLFLFSENNNLIEFNKEENQKPKFTTVDLLPLKPVGKTFIEAIKKVENAFEFDQKDAEIIGNIYSISESKSKRAMFKIESINGKKEKIETAETTELTEDRIKKCWQAGAEQKRLKIRGDITKKAGKTAKIIIGDEFDFYAELNTNSMQNLF